MTTKFGLIAFQARYAALEIELVIYKKRIACFICNLQEDVCFIIKSWGRLILECAYMILKISAFTYANTKEMSQADLSSVLKHTFPM